MVYGLVIYLVGDVKVIEEIVSDGLSRVALEFLIGGGSARCSSILLM